MIRSDFVGRNRCRPTVDLMVASTFSLTRMHSWLRAQMNVNVTGMVAQGVDTIDKREWIENVLGDKRQGKEGI